MEPQALLYLSEDKERSFVFHVLEHDFKQRYDVPHWLVNSESPFTWMQFLKSTLLVNANLPDKMHDYKNQGSDYGFEKFTILLAIMFMKSIDWSSESDESSESDKSSESDEVAEESKDEYFPRTLSMVDPEQTYCMCKAALDEMAAHEGDVMYTRIGPAMEHVLLSTRAQILFLNGNVAESKEIAANIKPIEGMSTENIAGIEGIKAKFTLSVYQNINVSLEASRIAQKLDPTFAAWMYLTGKILRRIRRDTKANMCKEELEHFISAVEFERNPKFLVFLAQSYQEMAISIMKNTSKGTSEEAEEMLDKSADLYRECWSLKNDSAPIARRVGNGMMKMKGCHRDLNLTKEALLKAAELSPVSVTLHPLGKFYLEFEQNSEKALECFKKVGSIYGTGEIIRFNLIKSYPNYDPYDLIQYWIDLAVSIVKRDMIHCDVGWYYLAFKNDLFTAVKFYWKILQKDFNSDKVTKFESFAFCVRKPINMLKLLVNEIKLLNMDSQRCSMETEKINFLNQFLEKVFEKHPDLIEMSPKADLLNYHRKVVQRSIFFYRGKQNQQQSFNERRRNTSDSWRVRNNEGVDNSEEDGRNYEEATNRNTCNQEGMRRGYRDGMRFSRSEAGTRSDWRREGTDSYGGNSRFDISPGEMEVSNGRGRGSSRLHRSGDFTSRNEGRDNRRQYVNNYNSNRYDTTVTDWRRRSNE